MDVVFWLYLITEVKGILSDRPSNVVFDRLHNTMHKEWRASDRTSYSLLRKSLSKWDAKALRLTSDYNIRWQS